MLAAIDSRVSGGNWRRVTRDMPARQACRRATGRVLAMVDWATGAAACWEECRCPWSGKGPLVSAGNFAERMRAAAAAGPGAEDTAGCRTWWAARPLWGVAQARSVYPRVIRGWRIVRATRLAMSRDFCRRSRWVVSVGASIPVGVLMEQGYEVTPAVAGALTGAWQTRPTKRSRNGTSPHSHPNAQQHQAVAAALPSPSPVITETHDCYVDTDHLTNEA